jgi:hypothetical protein
MNESSKPIPFASRLLEQEKSLNASQYQEHRVKLEQQLSRAEWKEKVARRVIVAALLIAMFLSGSRTFGSPDPGDKGANALSVAVGVIHIVSAITFWVGLASYFSRFVPGVKRARELLLEESIRELRHEVDELRKLVGTLQSKSES